MIGKLILGMQLAGFFVALVAALSHVRHLSPVEIVFIVGFGVHLAGDLWRIKREGL